MLLLAVSAHDIDAAGLPLEAELPPAWLADELADAGLTARPSGPPARVDLRLSRSGNDIVVRGRVRAALTTACARCLEPAAVDVDTTLTLLLQPAPAAPHAPAPANKRHDEGAASAKTRSKPVKKEAKKEEEYEFTSSEADQDTYDGDTVVLDPFVREAILLEVPNFPLCSEGCPGIRPAAQPASAEGGEGDGSTRPDPRLAPLGALRDRIAGHATPASPARPKKTKKKE